MSELLTQNTENKTGRKEFFESHERTIFLTEFAIRLMNKEGYAEVKKITGVFSMIWSIQCMADIMKRIMANMNDSCHKKDIRKSLQPLRESYSKCFDEKKPEKPAHDRTSLNPIQFNLKNPDALTEDMFLLQCLSKKILN